MLYLTVPLCHCACIIMLYKNMYKRVLVDVISVLIKNKDTGLLQLLRYYAVSRRITL